MKRYFIHSWLITAFLLVMAHNLMPHQHTVTPKYTLQQTEDNCFLCVFQTILSQDIGSHHLEQLELPSFQELLPFHVARPAFSLLFIPPFQHQSPQIEFVWVLEDAWSICLPTRAP